MDEAAVIPAWRSLPPPSVAAIVVAHDGAAWLPKVLASYRDLSFAPTHWHAVDVSSTDGSSELLRNHFGADDITYASSGTGFGDAVRRGLEALPRTEWIWLLHDDLALAPNSLENLLDQATSAGDVGVVGPKIREWPSLRRLLEVGVTVSGTAVRETGLETGEPDAGQHDRARDVLAVNTAGMLIRRDVWDDLQGLDPGLPLFGDDLDFGWRANRAGYRVRVAPAAVVFHAEASSRGVRRATAGDVALSEKRRSALYVVLANCTKRRFPWQFVRLFFGSLLRTLGFLIGQNPEAASDELVALREVYGRPGRLMAARRARQGTNRRPHTEIADLFAPWWLPYQHAYDEVRETIRTVVRPETIETTGRRSNLGDETADDVEVGDGPALWRRRPWLVTVLLLIVASLFAARGLGLTALSGGALLPAPDTAGGWWDLMVTRTVDLGLPTGAFGPTYVLLLAFAATPVWFAPHVVIWALLVFAAPLAALTAHRLARLVSDLRPARIIVAISYGLLVVGTGAVAEGRLGTVVALIVAPIVVNVALQLVAEPTWQTGLRLGLWVAVAAAFAPIAMVLAVGGIAMLALVNPQARKYLAGAVAVALLLLGPWTGQRVVRGWRIWWEAGLPVPGGADLRDVVFGTGGGASAMPWWLTIGVVLLGLAALVPALTRTQVMGAWAMALLSVLTACVGYLVTFTTSAGSEDVAAWLAVPAAVGLGALLFGVLVASEELEFLPMPIVGALVAVALVLPLGAGTWWLVRGIDQPLGDAAYSVVPVYLADRDGSTLVLTGDFDSGVNYGVETGLGPSLGQEAMARSSTTSRAVADAVGRLLSAPSADDIAVLRKAGIDAVYAPSADAEVATRLDAAPSLSPAGGDQPGSRVWTIEDEVDDRVQRSTWWRPLVGGTQALLWIVAVLLTAPVRRRADGEVFDSSEVAA